MAAKTVDIIANISNNLLKGIMAGKTLLALQGSARAGKTYNVTIFLILCCINLDFFNKVRLVWLKARGKESEFKPKDKILVSVVRLASPSLKRSVFRDFKEIMINMGIWDERKMNKTEMVYTFDNGSQMEFFATADNEQKVRGSKRDILFVNEANEITEWEFSQLRMRTEDFSIVDFNPSFTEEHWLFSKLHEDRTHHFISTFEHNPFLSEAIKDEIYSYQKTNPALWQIFGLGMFAIVEGLVFPKENWDICKFTDIPDGLMERIGIDVGFSGKGDPTAAIRCFYGNINGVKHMWVHQIVYDQGLSEKSLAYRLKPYDGIPKFIDSGNPLYIRNLTDNGCTLLKGVVKYANSVIDGLTAMMGYKIHITNTSVDIIKEFQNYVWLKDREDKYTNNPIDKWNHCFVADTKITTLDGEKRIADIEYGDYVLNDKGWFPVVKKFVNGKKTVLEVELEFADGTKTTLNVTPNHKIKTKDSWKQVIDLKTGDVLYLCKSSMEKNTISTKEKSIIPEDGIICTSKYGSTLMGQFQKAIMYTILTLIQLTTTSRIFNYFLNMNICRFMRKSTNQEKVQWRSCVKEWIMQEFMLPIGMAVKRAASGTENMVEKLRFEYYRKSSYACNADVRLIQSHSGIINSVATNVNPLGVETPVLTTKQEYVKFAENSSQLINTIKQYAVQKNVLVSMRVKRSYIANVYNIMVDSEHSYLAENLLVLNCIDAIRYSTMQDRSARFHGVNAAKKKYTKGDLGLRF